MRSIICHAGLEYFDHFLARNSPDENLDRSTLFYAYAIYTVNLKNKHTLTSNYYTSLKLSNRCPVIIMFLNNFGANTVTLACIISFGFSSKKLCAYFNDN